MLVSFQIDHPESLNYRTDSTLPIILESQKRGFKNYIFQPHNVFMNNKGIFAYANQIKFKSQSLNSFIISNKRILNLNNCKFLFIRQDPPFDMTYITSLYLLELLSKKVRIVNDPKGIRNAPEKILMLQFSKIIPPTLITRSPNEIKKFSNKYSSLIIKPLYGNGGESVFLLEKKDKNFNQIVENFLNKSSEPFILQKFIPEVKKGDKRVLIVNGSPVAAVQRVPKNNDIRSNIHVGGTVVKTKLTKNDLKICDTIKEELIKNNLFFVGIDIIGNYLTEINVTSPTCIQEIKKFSKIDVSRKIWDELLV
jgi:glutathione synthase